MDIKAYLEKYKVYVLAAAALAAFGLYQLTEEDSPSQPLLMEEEASTEPVSALQPQETPLEPSILMVDIKGAVNEPGIYSLKNGERINDAVAKAGGFQKEADRTMINLAQKLQDEMIIYVPKTGEELPAGLSAANPPAAASKAAESGSLPEKGAININTADATELQELPGIGGSKAQAIIDYRETEGAFSIPEDLKNVTGIGDKTFEKLAPLVTVQ